MVERGGKVIAKVVDGVGGANIMPLIEDNILEGSIVYADEWGGYSNVSNDYTHEVVTHG